MSEPHPSTARGLTRRLAEELEALALVFTYMAAVILAFSAYRHLVLAEYQLSYAQVGWGLMEALILAKAVLIGDKIGLGKRGDDLPLIIPVLYRSVLFAGLTVVFFLLEEVIVGLFHGRSPVEAISRIHHANRDEALARMLIMFVAFVPFFAFRALGSRVGLTEGQAVEMFFRRRRDRRP